MSDKKTFLKALDGGASETEKQEESYNFEEIMKANAEKAERIRKEKAKDNKKVLKDYRIK